ncbi:MAG: hypothetical protein HKN28_14745 [Alphaproteobacteria bacterium]|nr:hypothetical protein [Alphaproteobacteria bacterium]
MIHWRSLAALPLVAAFLLIATAAHPAMAQNADAPAMVELPAGMSQTEMEGFLARMTDGQVRQILIDQLAVMAEQSGADETGGTGSFLDGMQAQGLLLSERLVDVFGAVDEGRTPSSWPTTKSAATVPSGSSPWSVGPSRWRLSASPAAGSSTG